MEKHKVSIDHWDAVKLGVALALAITVIFCGTAVAENGSAATVVASSAAGLARKPMPRLKPGIVIGSHQSAGYSDLVTLVQPRLASGHIDSLPEFSKTYASMFKYTLLANITSRQVGNRTTHQLGKVGVGFAMDIKGRTIVITRETANQYGADLGIIDRGVLGGNEDCLDDVIQIARTDGMIVFDAKANMLVAGKHEQRVIRHFVWVSPASGKIGFLVWLLHEKGSDRYDVVSPTMQLLPQGFREDRQIHVSDGGFLSSIPTPGRFALVTIPQGKSVPFSERMKSIAGKKELTNGDLPQLVKATSESLALMKVAQN
jgi:hypothetical protein